MWKRFFSRQARKPSGLFGRIVAKRLFDRGNDAMNKLMLEVMAPQSGQAILEIGFGCGSVIQAAADRIGSGVVHGIDFSDAMLGVATKRNRRHIEAGRVSLAHGDFNVAEYAPESFDTVCSANTIYFWPDRAATCRRVHEALKPGGRVVLALVDKSKMDSMPLDMDVFQPISVEEVKRLLRRAGFTGIRSSAVEGNASMVCVTGQK